MIFGGFKGLRPHSEVRIFRHHPDRQRASWLFLLISPDCDALISELSINGGPGPVRIFFELISPGPR